MADIWYLKEKINKKLKTHKDRKYTKTKYWCFVNIKSAEIRKIRNRWQMKTLFLIQIPRIVGCGRLGAGRKNKQQYLQGEKSL